MKWREANNVTQAAKATSTPRQQIVGGPPVAADLGIAGARVVAPGDRGRSVLYQRMSRRQDALQMPPLCTNRVDELALDVVGRWIDSLAPPRSSP